MTLDDTRFRVLIVAPLGADARNTSQVLREAGLSAVAFSRLEIALEHLNENCGALLLTEEALHAKGRDALTLALSRQPPWSDLPIILIVSAAHSTSVDTRTLLGARGNVTLVERPLRVATLVAAIDVALRARRRQLELRDIMASREQLLDSLENRVTERTAKLQTMVGEMEAFSYSVSHDLRSPLRVLSGYAQTLCEDHAEFLSPEAKRYLEKIRKAAERMDRLTQDLLAYTRVASAELVLGPVNLDEVVRDVIETYPALRDAEASIRIESPLGMALGHVPSLVQCFSNLLENAVKFSPPGKNLPIEVFSKRRGNRLRCFVSDSGPGILRAHQKRIFDLFERASDASVPGTGVGLAIVKKAVERMGGGVGVNSVLGKGTKFWIDLKAVA
jgi:signal transduction histidine kinase